MPTTPPRNTTNQQVSDLWTLHHQPVRTYLIARAGSSVDHALIDDALAITAEQLIRHLRRDQPIASPGGWLRIVAWHEYLRLLRKHHRDTLAGSELADVAGATEDLATAIEHAETALALDNALEAALRRLTVLDMKLLTGHVEGLTYKKLARQTGLSQKAVYKALRRARKTLAADEALRAARNDRDRS